MKLTPEVREQFRRHGRTGGLRRARRLDPERRASVARRAATTRWIRARFGQPSFSALGLPGGEIVDKGLADLGSGRTTVESLLVSLAAPRLRREGVPVGPVLADPEDRLYELLLGQNPDLAHHRYRAYLKQMSSFSDTCPHARRRARRSAP